MTSFCLYGLGVTGKSVINYFDRKNLAITYSAWDDDLSKRNLFGYHEAEGEGKRSFSQDIDTADFIIVSPGINLKKSKLKRKLIENKHKIITDLDLFYLFNPKIKTIVIIEASSFQLSYSKFVRPNYAAILNITNDHLDWHGTSKNYVNSKFKIFSNQTKKDIAFIDDIKFLKKYKRARYRAKLKFIKVAKYKKIKKFIKNNYLNLEVNQQNMSFVQAISKTLKIANKPLIKSLRSFKGLPHRHEIIYKKNNKTFINDSKATSFEASKFALKGNKNIFWILGGLPKKGDKFKLGALKKNIIKAYIVGKSMSIFRRELSGNVNFQLCKTIKKAIDSIFNDTKNIKNEKIVILLSPCSASYDQFGNFEERGSYFKELIIKKFKGN